MPYKFETDKLKIANEKLDRRCKLTKAQRQEIFENKEGLSQRKLAKKYGVSRRLITFILDPEKKKRDLERRRERGGSKIYYDKQKFREQMRGHRRYKKELYDKNLLIK